jgi:hypothetical protein
LILSLFILICLSTHLVRFILTCIPVAVFSVFRQDCIVARWRYSFSSLDKGYGSVAKHYLMWSRHWSRSPAPLRLRKTIWSLL